MTKQELILLEHIKREYLDEALRIDETCQLANMALYACKDALSDNAHIDFKTFDISNFENGKYNAVFEDFHNAVVEFIKNYK